MDIKSPEIHRVVKWLSDVYSVQVKFLKFDITSTGRCYYEAAVILIEPDEDELKMLHTLLHEAGHYISYDKYRHVIDESCAVLREAWAMQYGWWLSQELGIDIRSVEWKRFHAYVPTLYSHVIGDGEGWNETEETQEDLAKILENDHYVLNRTS